MARTQQRGLESAATKERQRPKFQGVRTTKIILAFLSTFLLAVFIQSVIFRPAAWASTGGVLPDGTIVSHANTVIPVSQTVEEVVVVGHDVTVNGTITDNLVVINGNIHLSATARTGLIIDIGGQVTTEPGAKMKNVLSLWFKGPFQNSLAVGTVGLVLMWVMRVMVSVLLLVTPVVLAFFMQPVMEPMVDYLRQSARKTGSAGLLATVLAAGLAMLFAITVVGLPVAAILVGLYVLTGMVGLAVSSFWIGEFVTRGQINARPVWLQTLIGTTFLMAFSNVPLVGPLLLMLFWLLGTGAVSLFGIAKLRAWRTRRRLRKA